MKRTTVKIFAILIFVQININAQADSIFQQNKNDDTLFVMHKSPWGSVLRSAIFPGLGQFYNQSYWKVPVIWGICGWLLYNYIINDRDYRKYEELLIESNNANFYYKNAREFYRDQRDMFAIYLALTYLGNLVDAYVDAHLFDFSVKENFIKNTFYLNFRINF